MLDVLDSVKQEYLDDSVHKDIIIPVVDTTTDVSGVNWYIGDVGYSQPTSGSSGYISTYTNYDGTTWSLDPNPYIYKTYLDKAEYIYISFNFLISSSTTMPSHISAYCSYYDANGVDHYVKNYAVSTSEFATELGTGLRLFVRLPADDVASFKNIGIYMDSQFNFTYELGYIQVESSNDLYAVSDLIVHTGSTPGLPYLGESIIRQGQDPLDYITIGKDPINNITNDDLYFQSFRLQENLCSSNNLKFGACEASYVNFTMYNRNENFKGREIAPVIAAGASPTASDVEWINWYNNAQPVPGGTNTWTLNNVDAAFFGQFSNLGNTDVQYINKYSWVAISFKVKMSLTVVSGTEPPLVDFLVAYNAKDCRTSEIRNVSWHHSRRETATHYTQYSLQELSDFVNCALYIPLESAESDYRYVLNYLTGFQIRFKDAQGTQLPANYGTYNFTLTYKDIQINIVSEEFEELPAYDINDCLEYNGIDPSIYFKYSIPLGVYTISEVRKTEAHNLTKTEVTAYDKLTLLDQNAANWYTRYMYAYSTSTYQSMNGFECTRQIYSSYFNIAKSLGIETRTNYTETEVGTYNLIPEPGTYPYIVSKYSTWQSTPIPPSSSSNACKIHYSKVTISNPDPTFPYVVDATLPQNIDVTFEAAEYAAQVDDLLRGVTTANIIISETRDNQTYPTNEFIVDSGDYFKLSPDCTSFDIYVPTCMWLPILGFDNGAIVQNIKVSKVDKSLDLTNGNIRLMYYNWDTQDIFPCDSSITARDVVRSLLEVCGCLFRLDRYGMPKFLYPTMTALYPSNTLYPADDLYPRGSNGDILPMAKYSSFDYEDYQVQNIGRIQIVKKQTSDSTKSICEWEYEGDPNAINTYLIDDNIFYCSDKMEYEYGSMPEVSEMLVNMYSRIGNMKYCPHLTKALGMPWIEVGDRIGLLTNSGGIESFIYRRTLKGIQLLDDTYEAQGDEYVEKIKDYNYKVWEG